MAEAAPGDVTRIECDLCIVGAAPAARILARGLSSAGRRVLCLDPGVESEGSEDRPFIPLSRADFSSHGGSAPVAWPIAHEDLEPYFVHVRDRFELPMGIHDERVFVELPIEAPLFERERIRVAIGHFAGGSPMDIASVAKLPAGLEAISVDPRIRLALSPQGDVVQGVEAIERDGAGRSLRVEARAFVLASDAMTNARWLLTNRDVQTDGVGNDRGAVGRFATTRRAFVLAEVSGRGRKRLRELHRRRKTRNDFTVEPWLAIAGGETGRDIGVRFESLPRSGRQRQGEIAAESRAATPGLALGMRRLFATGAVVEGPDEERSFESAREGLSQPPAASTRESLRQAVDTLSSELERLTLGVCRPTAWLDDDSLAEKTALDFERPLSGEVLASTTRMSDSPADGVVDADGRVHGIGNLYIAGTSVLPALGWGDPIHPVAALTLRLEDHLRRVLEA